MTLHLGKLPATKDERDITFKALRAAPGAASMPTAPASFGHGTIFHDGEDQPDEQRLPQHWNMLGNGPDDTVEAGFGGAGDCAFALAGHVTMEANRIAGRSVVITGRNTIDDYSACTGYRLDDPTTDNGTNMRDLMHYWRDVGIADVNGSRHKIAAFVALDPKDLDELYQAAFVFSAVAIGFEFRQIQYQQFDQPAGERVWDWDASSPLEGGHAVPVFGRRRKRGGVVSWGEHVWFTDAFYENQNDEAWAFVFPDELRAGRNERGYDLSALSSMLQSIRPSG